MLESFGRLAAEADLVLVEGAGSASEVNLRASDIANMGFARAADVPVVLVGDIDRGGVIASLVGTKTVIDAADADMIVGFIVNRFRGDPTLFADGMKTVERAHRLARARPGAVLRGGAPSAGRGRGDPAGPARRQAAMAASASPCCVYPRIANFDDFDPLRLEPGVDLVFVGPHQPLPGDADLVILPGSKSTIADLASLRQFGWDIDLEAHVRRGGRVLGSAAATRCSAARSPIRTASRARRRRSTASGLLDVDTVLEGDKVLVEVSGETVGRRRAVQGLRDACRPHDRRALRPLLKLGNGKPDGAVSDDGRVAGCYIHGLLADDRQRQHWLKLIGGQRVWLRLRSRCRRHARPAGRPPREARRLRPPARAGARAQRSSATSC